MLRIASIVSVIYVVMSQKNAEVSLPKSSAFTFKMRRILLLVLLSVQYGVFLHGNLQKRVRKNRIQISKKGPQKRSHNLTKKVRKNGFSILPSFP